MVSDGNAIGAMGWDLATFHVVNGVADLYNLGFVSAEYVEFSGPGAGVSVNSQRAVEPA